MEEKNHQNYLSDEETTYYFEKFKNGDREAGNIIAENYFRLVDYIVISHYDIKSIEKDDLYSVGRIGLVKAMNSYNLDKNVKFSTYLVKCVQIELIHYYRKKKISPISIEELYYQKEDGNRVSIYEIKSLDTDFVEDFVTRDYVDYLLDTLDDKERDAIEMYFGLGEYKQPLSQTDIANKYGVTKQRISILIINTLKDLKHCATSKEYANARKLRKNS